MNVENNVFICIDGPPTALQRHRSFRLGSVIRSYDPQSELKKTTLKRVLSQIPKGFQPFIIPIELIIEFHMPIPKSWSKTKRRDEADLYHCKKPDLSNMIKFVEDTFNGILYLDDSLIARIHATKISSLDPKTIVCVRECISECSKIEEVKEETKIIKNLLFNKNTC